MILGSISIKSGSTEKRTVLSPETIKKLVAQNIKILINKGKQNHRLRGERGF